MYHINFFKQSGFSYLKRILLYNVHGVAKNDFKVFSLIGDSISSSLVIDGGHEFWMNKLFSEYMERNPDCKFLVDIGANIGMSSIQNASHFKKIYCIEPNPFLFKILKINTELNCDNNVVLYNFALGKKNESATLCVPKKNWGGGFVNTDGISYNEIEIVAKDNFKSLNKENYINLDIKVKNSNEFFDDFFKTIKKYNFKKGIIKLDVEGHETTIVEALLRQLPNHIKLLIVFENWDPNIQLKSLKNHVKKRNGNIYNVSRKYQHYPRFLRVIFRLLFGNIVSIEKLNKNHSGHIIIDI